MIRDIIALLPYVKGETENIRIAKGKYKMPTNLKEGYKSLRNEILWHGKSK